MYSPDFDEENSVLLGEVSEGVAVFSNIDDLVKSRQKDGLVKSSRCKARKNCGVRPLRARNDEVEAYRRRWIFLRDHQTYSVCF